MLGIDTREIEEIVIAMLVISFAILVAQIGLFGLFKYSIVEIAKQLGVLIIAVGLGFILHEMAHKFVAQRYGAVAGFRMWPLGLFMCLVFAILFGIVLAAPGAVYIYGERITRKQNGLISLAGPLTNLVLALIFLSLLPFAVAYSGPKSTLSEIALIGYSVNGLLALFNLLPVPPLDGSKIIAWNWMVWLGIGILVFVVYIGPLFLLA
ncbi:MAG: site-2 protease family protein [Candidatus Micrarchaeia archaeon]